jgi:hypothetical protein
MVPEESKLRSDCGHICPNPNGHRRHTERLATRVRTLTGSDRLDVVANIPGPKGSGDHVFNARTGVEDFLKAIHISFINAPEVPLCQVEYGLMFTHFPILQHSIGRLPHPWSP